MLLFELENVTHDFGRVRALSDIHLSLPVGAIGLVGQNGAGKSTLMQILLGLLRPSRGQARVMGWDVRGEGLRLRGLVGYMPERSALVSGLRGVEYAAFAGRLCGMSRREAWRRAHETLSYLGLGEARYRRLDEYSVGMRQRLKLAATLVHDPPLLVLDEPTSGLDPEGREAMLHTLEVLASRPGRSLLLSSHLLGDIERVCQTAVILDRGRIVHTSSIEALREVSPTLFHIGWDGEPMRLLARLADLGVEIQTDERGDGARVRVPDDWSPRNFFRESLDCKVVLTHMEPEEEDLDSVYRRLIANSASAIESENA